MPDYLRNNLITPVAAEDRMCTPSCSARYTLANAEDKSFMIAHQCTCSHQVKRENVMETGSSYYAHHAERRETPPILDVTNLCES